MADTREMFNAPVFVTFFLETRKVIEAMRSLTIQPHPSPHLAIHAFNFHPFLAGVFLWEVFLVMCLHLKMS